MASGARYRIRFLLQEIELNPGLTVFGRGETCQVTLHDDSLVSREHACIALEDDAAILRDLESRNGVTLNGKRLERPTRLEPGDRFRVGRTEMVFCALDDKPHSDRSPSNRQTGRDAACPGCGTVRSEGIRSCPSCGTSG